MRIFNQSINLIVNKGEYENEEHNTVGKNSELETRIFMRMR